MKNSVANSFLILPAIAFLMMASTASVSRAGTVAAPYEIGTWEGFRQAAVSYTFDDNVSRQYSIAVPMFQAAGFKITLFTVTGWSPNWSAIQTAASYGDEIGSHTVTHANLLGLSITNLPVLTNELANSQSIINSYITNETCVTLAYPNCQFPRNEIVVPDYYIAARICSQSLVPSTPSDFLQISSYILGNTGSYTNAANIISLANGATNSQSWCVYLIHSIDINDDYSPVSSNALQGSVSYLSTNQSTFWVETFGNVVRYIKERNASSVTETTNTGISITIQVTNNLTNPPIYLTNTIYNYPITIRRPLPTNWLAAAVSQNGQPINVQLVTVNSTNYMMFDVVPNGGDVVLSATALPFTLGNPARMPPSGFTFQLNGQSNVTYTIYSSTNLLNWLPIQTDTLVNVYTNLTFDTSSNPIQFYRAGTSP